MSISTVSLVGRPNVGKSTLFNKLCKSRDALVSDFEGLTRDRQYADIKLTDKKVCRLVDTGGLTTEDSGINKYIEEQSQRFQYLALLSPLWHSVKKLLFQILQSQFLLVLQCIY